MNTIETMNNIISEEKFVELISESIDNPRIEEFSFRFAGFDYTKDNLNIEDVIADAYAQMPADSLKCFSDELKELIKAS